MSSYWFIVPLSLVGFITLFGLLLELYKTLQETNSVYKNFFFGSIVSFLRCVISVIIVLVSALLIGDLGGIALLAYGVIIYSCVFAIGLVYSGFLALVKSK